MLIVAEIGQAHDGSLGILHSYIDAVAETKADAIKFQTHIAAAESSIYEPFRIKFSRQDKTRFDYWKRMEFTLDQWKEIKSHCDEKGLEFMSSPFSNAAVDLLEEVGVKRYKIGSGEVNNHLLLHKIAKTGKEIILSSGMSALSELDEAVEFIRGFGNKISILQCTTAYPTKPEEWGLNVIGKLRDRYGVPVGFSDHSGDIYACLAATALGAEILEFHVVFDKRMFGPDTKASLTIDETKKLVEGVKQIRISLTNPVDKSDNADFTHLKGIFEKSLAINRDMKANEEISLADLETKKPKDKGIDALKYKEVIGRRLKHELKQWDFLNINDLYD